MEWHTFYNPTLFTLPHTITWDYLHNMRAHVCVCPHDVAPTRLIRTQYSRTTSSIRTKTNSSADFFCTFPPQTCPLFKAHGVLRNAQFFASVWRAKNLGKTIHTDTHTHSYVWTREEMRAFVVDPFKILIWPQVIKRLEADEKIWCLGSLTCIRIIREIYEE